MTNPPALAARGRRLRPITGLGLASAGLLLTGACSAPQTPRPNLVLISVDALRPDLLDCYGGKEAIGAEVCALAQGGVRYAWAFSTASAGAPAVASILTSQYPSRHGVTGSAASFLRSEHATLASLLHSHGYATAAFVASPELNRSRNFQLGFDVFDDQSSRLPTPEQEQPPRLKAVDAWLSAARTPWFLWLHFDEPHGPFEPAAASPRAQPTELRQRYRKQYAAALREFDRGLSQWIAVLTARDEGVGILLAADHGQALGDGGRFGHGSEPDLELIRVPLLWRPPGAKPGLGTGRVVTSPVSLLDVTPTLLAAAGVPLPTGLAGRPLPLSDAETPPDAEAPRTLFAEGAVRAAVIEGAFYYSRDRQLSAADESPALALDPRLHPAAARFPAAPNSRERERLPRVHPPEPPLVTWEELDERIDEFLAR